MSLEGLQERLTALQETTSQLKELIDRLANIKFQPGSVPLRTDEENTVSAELSSEINQTLREEEDELEILQEEVEDLRSGRPGSEMEHQKARLKDGIERLGKELSRYRVSFCKAQLSARRSLVEAQRLERELLLKSYSEPASLENSFMDDAPSSNGSAPAPAPYPAIRRQHQSALSEEDQQMVNASSEVTRGMLRLRDNIERALTQSHATYETLEESSLALGQVGESYMSLDSMLASSRELLSTLLRSQKSDTWYLRTTFYMLLGVLSWLVFRRFLYGPLWLLVWFPLKIMLRTTVGVSNAVAKRGGQSSPADPAVAEEAKVSVEGIPDASLPTVRIGQEEEPADTGADPESMMEKVGKIVDGNGDSEAAKQEGEPEAPAAEENPVQGELGEKDEL